MMRQASIVVCVRRRPRVELLARVRAVLRNRAQDGAEPRAVLTVRDLTMDVPRRRVTLAGSEVKLSRKEFALLRCCWPRTPAAS